jgi:hypothetical protein
VLGRGFFALTFVVQSGTCYTDTTERCPMNRPSTSSSSCYPSPSSVISNIFPCSIRGKPTKIDAPAWGLGVWLKTPHHKNKFVMKCHKGPRSWTDSLDNRLNSGNACYHSVQNLMSSRLLSKNVKLIQNYNFACGSVRV